MRTLQPSGTPCSSAFFRNMCDMIWLVFPSGVLPSLPPETLLHHQRCAGGLEPSPTDLCIPLSFLTQSWTTLGDFSAVWSLLTARPSPSLGLATLFPPLNQLSGARGLSRELYFPLYVKQQRSQRSQVPARMTVARLGHKQNICSNSPLGQGRAQCASYNVRLQTQCLLRRLRPAFLFSFCYC